MDTTNIKYLNENETAELFGVLKKDSSTQGVRNRAIFYIARYCALRVSEVGMLKMVYYNEVKGELYCCREKNSYSNTIRIIDEEVRITFEAFLTERKKMNVESKYIFLSQRKQPISRKTLDYYMRQYCKHTNIPSEKHHFHVLRHTRAIELADSNVDVKDIQWWLGHKNIMNTMIYMQFTTKQQDALYRKLEDEMRNAKEININR